MPFEDVHRSWRENWAGSASSSSPPRYRSTDSTRRYRSQTAWQSRRGLRGNQARGVLLRRSTWRLGCLLGSSQHKLPTEFRDTHQKLQTLLISTGIHTLVFAFSALSGKACQGKWVFRVLGRGIVRALSKCLPVWFLFPLSKYGHLSSRRPLCRHSGLPLLIINVTMACIQVVPVRQTKSCSQADQPS